MPATRIGTPDVPLRSIISKIMMPLNGFFKPRLPNKKLRRYRFIGPGRTPRPALCQGLSDDYNAR
jgi:hypothetical protein